MSPHLKRSALGAAWLALGIGALALCCAVRADPTEEEGARPDPDVVAGRKAIDQKDWSAAIRSLSAAALRDTKSADIQNWLGYAYRNAGQLPQAFEHYERALALNPRHRGAHEYIGEAYLIAGRLPEAEEHLKALQQICLIPCEELDDLKAKVERYRREGGREGARAGAAARKP